MINKQGKAYFVALTHEGILLSHPFDGYDTSVRTLSSSKTENNIEVDIFNQDYIEQGITKVIKLENPVIKLAHPLDDERTKTELTVIETAGRLISDITEYTAQLGYSKRLSDRHYAQYHRMGYIMGTICSRSHLPLARYINSEMNIYYL